MSGYRGDGFGMHGDHGDEDFEREMRERRGDGRRRDPEDGRNRDFMLGPDRHERDRERGGWQSWDDGPKWNERRPEERYLGDRRGEGGDERAIRAAEAYRSRFGAHGHEGQYGGGAAMDLDRHGGNERWDSDRERRHNFSGVGRFGTGQEGGQRGGGLHDDHYRSWRDRQIAELDRDYEEYCREREQEFGSSFDSWRQQRRSQTQDQTGVQPGETVSSSPGSEAEIQQDQASDSLVSNEESGRGKRR